MTGSTRPEIKVEICAACHPFFTGEMRFVDTLGRVEKFMQKQKAAVGKTVVKKRLKKLIKKQREAEAEAAKPKTLKEMVERAKKEESTEVKKVN